MAQSERLKQSTSHEVVGGWSFHEHSWQEPTHFHSIPEFNEQFDGRIRDIVLGRPLSSAHPIGFDSQNHHSVPSTSPRFPHKPSHPSQTLLLVPARALRPFHSRWTNLSTACLQLSHSLYATRELYRPSSVYRFLHLRPRAKAWYAVGE